MKSHLTGEDLVYQKLRISKYCDLELFFLFLLYIVLKFSKIILLFYN